MACFNSVFQKRCLPQILIEHAHQVFLLHLLEKMEEDKKSIETLHCCWQKCHQSAWSEDSLMRSKPSQNTNLGSSGPQAPKNAQTPTPYEESAHKWLIKRLCSLFLVKRWCKDCQKFHEAVEQRRYRLVSSYNVSSELKAIQRYLSKETLRASSCREGRRVRAVRASDRGQQPDQFPNLEYLRREQEKAGEHIYFYLAPMNFFSFLLQSTF